MENTNHSNDQVFISFRGKDERYGYLTILKQGLLDGNVNVFIDDNAPGQPLKNRFGHIRKSRIAIVIFPKNYAESRWCLDELVEIMKCVETEKLKAVIPIFRKVKVFQALGNRAESLWKSFLLQNSLLAEEFNKKKIKHINSKIKRWKKALKFVTGMIGLTYDKKMSELEFVGKVVEKVHINLAKIAAEARPNSTPETRKTPLGKLSNLIVFNINQLNINSLIHSSKTLEALTLSLNKLNPDEGYNRNVDLNPLSGDYRRIVSYRDERDRLGPLPFEAIMDQKRAENQRSIEPLTISSRKNIGVARLTFRLCVTISSFVCVLVEQKMIQLKESMN